MNTIQHRMIYYAPTADGTDLRRGTVTRCGAGTVLIDWAGIHVLVDPAGAGAVPEPAGARTETGRPWRWPSPAMPTTIDAVVLSRLRPGVENLRDLPLVGEHTPVITHPDAVDRLDRHGFENIHQLSTWERIVLRKGDASVSVVALPGRCGTVAPSAGAVDVMGALLELRPRPDAEPYRLYLSAGTLSIDEIEEIPERFPSIDLAVLHLGGATGDGEAATMDARHGLDLFDTLRPGRAVLVPCRDDDACARTVAELLSRARNLARDDRFTCPAIGSSCRFRVPDRGLDPVISGQAWSHPPTVPGSWDAPGMAIDPSPTPVTSHPPVNGGRRVAPPA